MLNIENLSKSFHMRVGDEKTVPCLDSVTLAVAPGQMLAVIGPSGAGKSSLLKCVYGTYLATGGNIYYTDSEGAVRDLARADLQTMRRLRAREIGYVSQFFHVIPRISALDILTEPLTNRGVLKSEALARAKELLLAVGLPESLWHMYPSTFSGGEKQRLNVVYGLITRPRLLLLDEPTSSLDPQSKLRVLELIRDLKNRGSVILGVFHDYYAMRSVADCSYHIVTRTLEAI
ncbi:MAG: ATP-binding cassette domain-containing protein [Oscillospiraceae bacterium]|jgi:alpha-D-ribose 1-methylphosphonate 5-triphosphate synthase subunit PhnL|nr:ATP-binding cassette domain-containing protein [Oscillospiraceae bacterium]